MSHTHYYQEQLKTYQNHVKYLTKQMATISVLRVLVFVLFGLGVYMSFNIWEIAIAIGGIGLGVFLYLLSKYTDAKRQRAFNNALVDLNKEEIKIAAGNFYHRDTGLQFQDPKHFYSLDIDLFGRGSFYQYLNRTTIPEGRYKLAGILKANTITGIASRQEAIKELSTKPQWRQYYWATSSLVDVETPAKYILAWLKSYHPFLPKALSWLPLVFSFMSILVFVLTYLGLVSNQAVIGYWLLIGIGITGSYLKKINVLASNTDKLRATFRQYAQLLDLIENETFTSALLIQKQIQIQADHKKASNIFKLFSKHLDALDNRNNIIGAIFGNGLFLTDLRNSYLIEKWIEQYGHKVADWFEVVSFFDAYNSLGNYAYNHSDFVYPELVKEKWIIEAKNLGHPLLEKRKRVASDFHIDNEQFFIITGANMAGKSTFLRTVSLHIVMANVGLPVCATSSQYSPVKLITSMRTSDSLTDDSSYFFAELTRLKYIVDTIKEAPCFIVLDEILKGTNSTDKAIGSKKFVEKLVASKATGIIATHDLSLCDMAEVLEEVKNYYFDAEVIENELYFDYKLKQGICQNMNASFLLKKMNIV